jgi:ATP-dependent DNA helicase RecQ
MTPREALHTYWAYTDFRPLQESIIESVIEGRDTLALLPTGGGKSITFQVPALVLPGISLVISPLIALMKDQVMRLKSMGITAEFLHSGLSFREIDRLLDNAVFGKIKLLYISPERLNSSLFLERIQKMQVSLLAVDEAHCISQWGNDFRPSYLRIGEFREYLGRVPVLALTATATAQVRRDIENQLNLRNFNTFLGSFKRSNLFYEVVETENKWDQVLQYLRQFPGTALVYTRNRKRTKELSDFLNRNNIRSGYYHAGLSFEERERVQKEWVHNEISVMVATNAFGMGIDKADVRLVIHFSPPDNLESYYQESGRAGRDGKNSRVILLFEPADKREIWELFNQNHPEVKEVLDIYESLCNYLKVPFESGGGSHYDFDLRTFSADFSISAGAVFQALRILENQGLLRVDEKVFIQSEIRLLILPRELSEYGYQNPLIEKFMLAVLRTYGGALQEPVPFNESELAQNLEIRLEDLKHLLIHLEQASLIEYCPRPENTQIVFLKNRESRKNIDLDSEKLKKLYSIQRDKLTRMMDYVENEAICRTRFLLNYFDEEVLKDCGYCDICSSRKHFPVKDIRMEILEKLSTEPVWIGRVTSLFPEYPSDKVLFEIQELVERGNLWIDPSYHIRKGKKSK